MQKYKKYHIRNDNSSNPILYHCNNLFNFPPPRAERTPQAPLSRELPIITVCNQLLIPPPRSLKNAFFFVIFRAFFRYKNKPIMNYE